MEKNRHPEIGRTSEPAKLVRHAWHELARYSSILLVLIICCLTAALGIFAVRDLRTADAEADMMYEGSVLGLRKIGELQYQAQETRRVTLYALTTNNSNLQVDYADQSREADRHVTEAIAEYIQHARNHRELEMGQQLQQDWKAYLGIRDEVLALILEGSVKEAVEYDLKGGVPSFERVRADLEQIKRLYDEGASQQLAELRASSLRSRYRVIGMLLFTLLFVSFAIWAVQRSRTLATLELARLQMDFVASISHELRTPLAVIRSAAENIMDGVIEGPDELTKYGSMIRSQTRQITELVNQILLFASTKGRNGRYVLRPLQVEEIVDLVLENTSELVAEEGLKLERHIEPGMPLVRADANALCQCLQNLVTNAIKYCGTHKWISVDAYAAESAHEVRISVKDRGIGISKSELPRVFEPFYRSPAVCAAQIHGTGLGLPLAKTIAESMGGSLSVVSELGQGSTFTIHLPVVEEYQLQPEVTTPAV